MGTVKRKVSKTDKQGSVKRGKSLPNHYHTKYNTIDSRTSSRAGSRPSLSGISTRSEYDGTCTPGSGVNNMSHTPSLSQSASPQIPRSNSIPASPRVHKQSSMTANNSVSVPHSMNEQGGDQTHIQEALTQNEEAIAATIVASNNALKVDPEPPVNDDETGVQKRPSSPFNHRSHSFSVSGKKANDAEFRLNRTGSTTSSGKGGSKKFSGSSKHSSVSSDTASDFTARLSMIQSELHKQFVVTQSTDPAER